jgi:hypothetical protein
MTPEQSLQEAIRRAGGQRALARRLGIAQQRFLDMTAYVLDG